MFRKQYNGMSPDPLSLSLVLHKQLVVKHLIVGYMC